MPMLSKFQLHFDIVCVCRDMSIQLNFSSSIVVQLSVQLYSYLYSCRTRNDAILMHLFSLLLIFFYFLFFYSTLSLPNNIKYFYSKSHIVLYVQLISHIYVVFFYIQTFINASSLIYIFILFFVSSLYTFMFSIFFCSLFVRFSI